MKAGVLAVAWSVTMILQLAIDAYAEPILTPCCECTATGVNRAISNLTATGMGDRVVLTWLADAFDDNTEFVAWRSVDGGVTFDSCATNQAGQCAVITYQFPEREYTLTDYGVKNSFSYSYRIQDSEGLGYWYLSAPLQGWLAKPAPPNPANAPSVNLSNLWTIGSTAQVQLSITPTLWAWSYTISYYDQYYPTVHTVTRTLLGQASTVLAGLSPLRDYHIKVQANGMSASTPYSVERHVRIMPAPNLYVAEVVGGTSISLQWSSIPNTTGVEYDVLYRRVSPEPPGGLVIVNAGTQRIWRLSGLQPHAEYEVQVRARDSWGNPSQPTFVLARQTGAESPTDAAGHPKDLSLEIFPVPFRTAGNTSFQVALPRTEQIAVTIFDARGQVVRKVFEGRQGAGLHRMSWDGRNEHGLSVATGVYMARLQAGEEVVRRKVVLVR